MLKQQGSRRQYGRQEPTDLDTLEEAKNPEMRKMVELTEEAARTMDPSIIPDISPLSPPLPIPAFGSSFEGHDEFPLLPPTATRAKGSYAYMGPSNGYVRLFAYSNNRQGYDWVGLYRNQSDNINRYITWQWASRLPYTTSTYIASGLHVRYFRYILVGYFELFR